jgi:hypothetical protein
MRHARINDSNYRTMVPNTLHIIRGNGAPVIGTIQQQLETADGYLTTLITVSADGHLTTLGVNIAEEINKRLYRRIGYFRLPLDKLKQLNALLTDAINQAEDFAKYCEQEDAKKETSI